MNTHLVVLVAEDEALIRMGTVDALRDEGFEVLEAEHAAGALILLSANAPNIHALFTDIQMPGDMDGLALANHTALSWPWIALLLSSGRVRPTTMPVNSRFVPKPYEHANIIQHLREMTVR